MARSATVFSPSSKKRAASVKTVRAAGLPPRSDRLDIRSAEGVVRRKCGQMVNAPDSGF